MNILAMGALAVAVMDVIVWDIIVAVVTAAAVVAALIGFSNLIASSSKSCRALTPHMLWRCPDVV